MKNIIFLLIIIPAASFAQQGFYVGVHVNNGLYWLYNKNDFHPIDSTYLKPISPSAFNFNNYFIGLNFGVNVSRKFSIESCIRNSKFEQIYHTKISTTPLEFYTLSTKLNYGTFQLSGVLQFSDPEEHTVLPFIKIGLNASYLFKYVDRGEFPLLNNRKTENIFSNFNYSSKTYIDTALTYDFHGRNDFIYNRIDYGVNLSLGTNIIASDHFQVGIELFGEFDFKNTDNLSAKIYPNDSISNLYWTNYSKGGFGNDSSRSPSHNYYFGLGISINYYFRSRYDF